MLLTIGSTDWQILRAANRQGVATGRAIRISMTRATKSGEFLVELCDKNLLQVVTPGNGPFEATYRLTSAGEFAAEYGEYYYSNAKTLRADDEQPWPNGDPRFKAKIIEMGAKVVAETFRKVWTTEAGTPFLKSKKRHEQEAILVVEYCKILDWAFKLGPQHACRTLLCDKAVEMGLLEKSDQTAGGYALALPEEQTCKMERLPVR